MERKVIQCKHACTAVSSERRGREKREPHVIIVTLHALTRILYFRLLEGGGSLFALEKVRAIYDRVGSCQHISCQHLTGGRTGLSVQGR